MLVNLDLLEVTATTLSRGLAGEVIELRSPKPITQVFTPDPDGAIPESKVIFHRGLYRLTLSAAGTSAWRSLMASDAATLTAAVKAGAIELPDAGADRGAPNKPGVSFAAILNARVAAEAAEAAAAEAAAAAADTSPEDTSDAPKGKGKGK